MRGKRRPPEERIPNVAGPLPPCKVCGEPAAGFHYGVNTCEACKGFFRRSLIRNRDYTCIGSGNCPISTNRRKSCPKCRYLKCLNVGMSKEAIKTGRYTYMKRTQDTLEIKRIREMKDQDVPEQSKDSNSLQISDIISQTLHSRNASPNPSTSSSPSFSCDLSSTSSPDQMVFTTGNTEHNKSTVAEMSSIPIQITSYDSAISDSKIASPSTSKRPAHCHTPQDSSENISKGIDCSCLLSPDSLTDNSSKPSTPMEVTVPSPLACTLSESPPLSLPFPETHQAAASMCRDVDDSEIDALIASLVASHKQIIFDSNSLSDEFFKEQFEKCKEECKLKEELFGHMGPVTKADYDHIYKTTGIDVDGRINDISHCAHNMERDIRQMITFMKSIPGFRNISMIDQTSLVKACIYELFTLSYFKGYNSEDRIVVESTKNYCWHDMTKIYEPEFIKLIFNITRKLQELELTFDMIVIIKCICIFFPDRLELENYDAIQKLHFKMVCCLIRLLQVNCPDRQGMILSRIVGFFTSMRTIDLECRKLWKELEFDQYPPVASRPILIEIFSGNMS